MESLTFDQLPRQSLMDALIRHLTGPITCNWATAALELAATKKDRLIKYNTPQIWKDGVSNSDAAARFLDHLREQRHKVMDVIPVLEKIQNDSAKRALLKLAEETLKKREEDLKRLRLGFPLLEQIRENAKIKQKEEEEDMYFRDISCVRVWRELATCLARSDAGRGWKDLAHKLPQYCTQQQMFHFADGGSQAEQAERMLQTVAADRTRIMEIILALHEMGNGETLAILADCITESDSIPSSKKEFYISFISDLQVKQSDSRGIIPAKSNRDEDNQAMAALLEKAEMEKRFLSEQYSRVQKEMERLREQGTVQHQAMESDDHLCSICTERVNNRVTSCGHIFCDICITACLKKSSACPICRAAVTTVGPLFLN